MEDWKRDVFYDHLFDGYKFMLYILILHDYKVVIRCYKDYSYIICYYILIYDSLICVKQS